MFIISRIIRFVNNCYLGYKSLSAKLNNSQLNHLHSLFLNIIVPFIVVCGFFLLCGIVLILRGQNPFEFYTTILQSGFSSVDNFASVLFNSTPLIFTGLAVAIAFKGGLFNIGCEGQLYVAAFSAALVGIYLNLPSIILIPICIGTAMFSGAIWGAIPGLLKAKFGAHEVINTIMMNFIALALTNFLVTSVFREPGQMTPQTAEIYPAARLMSLGGVLPFVDKRNLLDASFLIAILCVILSYIFLKNSKWGYELRLVGNAPDAATYGGIKPEKVMIWTMALSGAIAGLAGVSDVLGYRHRFLDNFSSGWGFTGIAVALLGRNHPLGVFVAALLFGMLNIVALDIELLLEVPRGLFLAGQGLLIIVLVCIEGLSRRKNR